MVSSVNIRPHLIHMRCVKFQSLGLDSAVFLRWLELSDCETEEPGEMVLHHLAGTLTQR